MPKGSQGQKRPADVIGNAVRVMRIATGEIEEKLPERSAAAELGSRGCKARAADPGATVAGRAIILLLADVRRIAGRRDRASG